MTQQASSSIQKITLRAFIALFLIKAVLVATHEGEFWPFSIFPMFSQAGKPWLRGMARDVSNIPPADYWKLRNFEELPGDIFALSDIHLNQNDVSNFLQKAKSWDATNLEAMRHLFKEALDTKTILLYKVTGKLADDNGKKKVEQLYTPFILMTKEKAILNPNLEEKNTWK